MTKDKKRLIAKEIIILFATAALIGVVYFFNWYSYQRNYSKYETISKNLNLTTFKKDSIEKSFPKRANLSEVWLDTSSYSYITLKGNLCNGSYYNDTKILEDELGLNYNKTRLLKLLLDKNFPFFNGNGYIPCLSFFCNQINTEVKSNSFPDNINERSNIINQYYTFLKNRVVFKENVDVVKFASTIADIPPPPPHSSWEAYEKEQLKIEQLTKEKEQAKTKNYQYSKVAANTKPIALLLLLLIYPIRLLIYLLVWAIRTLRESKEQ